MPPLMLYPAMWAMGCLWASHGYRVNVWVRDVDRLARICPPEGITVVGEQVTTFSPSLVSSDLVEVLEGVAKDLGAREVRKDSRICKVSVVGVGMRSHAGVASQMFETLAAEGIDDVSGRYASSVE